MQKSSGLDCFRATETDYKIKQQASFNKSKSGPNLKYLLLLLAKI